ncbi:MAG: sugar ABC transporter permease [Halanaerobiales bacterium]|nr:sugar ABC transporter permease [Halanaerobiales bacterium]
MWRKKYNKWQRVLAPYIFIAPGFLFYMMVTFIPAVVGIWLSFHKWSIISPKAKFVGLQNYITMIHDERFWTAVKNTAIYSLGIIPGIVVFSLLLALLLNTKIKGIVFFRTLFYLPVVTPIAVASVIWMWIYHPRIGVMNSLIGLLGFNRVNWLGNPNTVMWALIIIGVWLAVGSKMIIYLAALQGIPRSYYEAAQIDGAGKWKSFWYITLPLLKPTTLFIVITTTMGAFMVFSQVNIMTQGGPVDKSLVLVYYIFERGFTDLRMGYASAMSMFLFIVTVIFTLINWKLLGRNVSYE